MKILAGSLQCESNSFCTRTVALEDFAVREGAGALERLAAAPVFRGAGAEPVALPHAVALPGGPVRREAFEALLLRFAEAARQHRDADGVYLHLHGSMVVEGGGSGEERLLRALREILGDEIPVACALDAHANLSGGFLSRVNALFGFRTIPHTDQDETERRAAAALLRCVREGIRPRPAFTRVPVLAADAAVTAREPLKAAMEALAALDGDPDVVSAAVFHGQPWVDAPYTGQCVAVCRACGTERAAEDAAAIGRALWRGRRLFTIENAMEPAAAVRRSLQGEEGTVFVTDSGDNTTAGAEGDGTFLLDLYLKAGARSALVCGVTDANAVNGLLGCPAGSRHRLRLGGGTRHRPVVEMEAVLIRRGTVLGWSGEAAGEGVLLSAGGVDVVLTNARAAFTSPAHFVAMGVDTRAYRAVALKMGYLFPLLKPLASGSIFALTPGTSTNDFSQLDFRHARPMYPVNPSARFPEPPCDNEQKERTT